MPDPDLVAQASSAISAAVGAYGAGVLSRVEGSAADKTVHLGQQVLVRIFKRGKAPGVERAVTALSEAEGPDEAQDARGALRMELRALLKTDERLRSELSELVSGLASGHVEGSGERAIVVGGDSSGINSTGDHAINILSRNTLSR